MTIRAVQADHYRIPLPRTLSDATHGDITRFELITARVADSEGGEGVGYTYTVGAGGDAVRSLIQRELAPLLTGEDPARIEYLWNKAWWGLHYAGRGGAASFAISAVARVAAMRDLLGPDFPLMVDANMGWGVDHAIRASHAFAEYGVFWLEEPTIPDDIAGHARIMRDGALPVATGENMHTLHEFQNMIAAGGVAFPEPDVSNCGGITVWMKVAHLAEANNLPVTSHGVHDLHVHLLAAVPNKSYLEVHGFGLDRFIERPMVITDGLAHAPDMSGHGVAFDWAKLEEFRAS